MTTLIIAIILTVGAAVGVAKKENTLKDTTYKNTLKFERQAAEISIEASSNKIKKIDQKLEKINSVD